MKSNVHTKYKGIIFLLPNELKGAIKNDLLVN